MEINQQIIDEVKQKPVNEQIIFLIGVLDSEIDFTSPDLKSYLIQFEDLLRDLKSVNCSLKQNKVKDKVDLSIEEFNKLLISEVIKLQELKTI